MVRNLKEFTSQEWAALGMLFYAGVHCIMIFILVASLTIIAGKTAYDSLRGKPLCNFITVERSAMR